MKDKTTALIYSILLGGLGVDRFYLGYTALGVVKLLTAGCFGIMWIIDIVLIATDKLLPADGSAYGEPSQGQPIRYSSGKQDYYSELERIAQLHSEGILSDEEFREMKAQILNKMK